MRRGNGARSCYGYERLPKRNVNGGGGGRRRLPTDRPRQTVHGIEHVADADAVNAHVNVNVNVNAHVNVNVNVGGD
jgi:hypothetical protein